MKLFKYLCFVVATAVAYSCSDDTPSNTDPETPENPTPGEPEEPDVPSDPKLLYNGIKLPDAWPPVRSYTSDIEKGMSPFYLETKPEVINISVGRQFFVDDFLIKSTTLKRVYHYPELYAGNPVLKADKAWEMTGTKGASFAAPFSDGVWYDESEQKFKMWYMGGGGSYSVNGAGVMCYAESTDGINWTKPELSVVKGTNIVDYNSDRDASVVWIDKQEENSSKRYKMFLVERVDSKWRYTYKTSADGKTWRETANSKDIADRSTVYKNPFRNNWVFSMRHNVRINASKLVRARDYNENEDPVAGTKNAEAKLSAFWFGPWPNELHHPSYPDVDPAIYNLDATPYESLMLGFFSVWAGPENDVCASDNVIKRNQVMVGYSRDGYSWYREDMNPFIPVSENTAAWNAGNVQSVAGSPLIVNDKLYFYVSGRRLDNGNEITTTGLATLRRDGFASMTGSGELTTNKLQFDGKYFFVNAKITGSLKVELLNENGEVISGFSKDDCNPITGDSTKKLVTWSSNQSLEAIQGKNIIVKFYLDGGDLYSFWISTDESGTSKGYTGGGGPGFNVNGQDKK